MDRREVSEDHSGAVGNTADHSRWGRGESSRRDFKKMKLMYLNILRGHVDNSREFGLKQGLKIQKTKQTET